MSLLDIKTAEVFEPLLYPSRYKGAYGGRGSAKSHFFAELMLEECLRIPTRAVCVREVQKSLEQSVKRLLEDKIHAFSVDGQFRILDTHIETPWDGIIIFQGMQTHTVDSIKSLEGYRLAWAEEAQNLSERSLTLLRPTIRMPNSEIWLSWNPRFPTDPVEKLLRGPIPLPDSIVVRTSYQDNPWFPDVLRREMEWDRNDIDKWKHVWAGGYEEHSDANVFKNWRIEEFDTPENAVFLLGGDWGFSMDPTVLIRLFERTPPGARKRLYIDAECYKIGCEIDHTPALFDTMGCKIDITPLIEAEILAGNKAIIETVTKAGYGSMRRWPIIADSARPETISYLRRHGYSRIESAKKGPNSVKEGIIFLQGYDIIIHPRCRRTIDEFTHYKYEIDQSTGLATSKLPEKKNHVIDSTRYAAERIRHPGARARPAVWG